MLLTIDVGNTNTSLGVYSGAELRAHWRLTTARARTVDEYGVHARNLFAFAGLDFKAITAVAVAVPPAVRQGRDGVTICGVRFTLHDAEENR